MMFHRLGLMLKKQRGFTVLELLIAITITGVVAGAATTTIFQVFDGSARSSNYMTAIRQVQNAGFWVSRDVQMAQSVVITGVSGFPLTLTWTDWESGDEHQVTYNTLSVDNKLQRQHTCVALGLDETGIMAQYIDPDPAETKCEFAAGSAFSLPDATDAFTITDAAGGDSGTITVTAGSVTATPAGGATVDGDIVAKTITSADEAVAWTTPAGGGTIEVVATKAGTEGAWTSIAKSATAAVTVDDGDATLTDGGALVFTVTATVGTGRQEQSETRVYKVVPRPS